MKQTKVTTYTRPNGDTYEVVQDRFLVRRKGFLCWEIEFHRSCCGITVGHFWTKRSAIQFAQRLNWAMKDIELHDCHEFETTGIGPKVFHEFEEVDVVQQ